MVTNVVNGAEVQICPLIHFPAICPSTTHGQHFKMTEQVAEVWNLSWHVILWQMILSSLSWTAYSSWTKFHITLTLAWWKVCCDLWPTVTHYVEQMKLDGFKHVPKKRKMLVVFFPQILFWRLDMLMSICTAWCYRSFRDKPLRVMDLCSKSNLKSYWTFTKLRNININ